MGQDARQNLGDRALASVLRLTAKTNAMQLGATRKGKGQGKEKGNG